MGKCVDKEKADKSSNDTEEKIKEGTEEANNARFDKIDDRLDELMATIGGSKSETVVIHDGVESSSSSQFDKTDSPVFNYINSFSPLRTVKSIPNIHPFSSPTFPSSPPVFTSPRPSSLHKESRCFKIHNSTNEEVSAKDTKDASMGEEASIEKEIPGSGTNSGVEQQKWYDNNVQRKNETPGWESLISDASELLIYGSPNDSEAFRLSMMQKESTSKARFNTVVGMPTMQPHSNTAACKSSSRRVVPSIGLHQNAIVMSSKDSKTNVTHDNSSSGKMHLGLQGSVISTLQETLDHTENETLEELHLSSPKKKRAKLESGEGESCKRCNCKKSKCLKLYCDCFAAGVYCKEPCSCVACLNKPIHDNTVLATRKQIKSRNPSAFAPKSKTTASAPHKRGCNCRKSNCLKKYCECYQGGVGCSKICRCEGCKNAFGRKDEAEQEKENETSEKSRTAKTQQNTEVLMRKEASSALPSTPMAIYRQQMDQQPFSSSKNMMPPPQSLFGCGSSSSSGVFNSQNVRKPDISLTHSRIEKSFETDAEDGAEEMPKILINSPKASIKSVSPNGKRVSPPHLDSSSSGSVNLREK